MATDHGPGVRIPPPLAIAVIIILAELINRLLITFPLSFYNIQIAGLLYTIGTIICGLAAYGFWDHKTNIIPHKPDSTLITNGIFQYSRNPIYLSFMVFQLMFAFIFHNAWQVLFLPASYGFLRYYVIEKEERYLETLFKQPYSQYKNEVRRWF